MGGIPEGLHSPEDPTGYFVLCPRPSKLDSGPAAILIPQSHLQVAGRGGGGSPFHITHMYMGKVGDKLGQSRTVPARDLRERTRLEALDSPLPQP